MTAFAHIPATVEIRAALSAAVQIPAAKRTRLLPTEDGWSLVGPNGELIFRGLGRQARRQCLEAARERGIVAVFS